MPVTISPFANNDIMPYLGTGEYFTENDNSELRVINDLKIDLLNKNNDQAGGTIVVDAYSNTPMYVLGTLNNLKLGKRSFSKDYLEKISRSLATYKIVDSVLEESNNYSTLYSKYQKVISRFKFTPTISQEKVFLNMLRTISKYYTFQIDTFEVVVSAENELLLVKENDIGLHYLIVGKNPESIFYGYSGVIPGDFFSIKYKEKEMGIEQLVKYFLTR